MFKFEFIPKNVCSNKITYLINGNEVLHAKVEGGCMGGSQALSQAAIMIKDIDKIIDAFSGIACGGSKNKKTSCAQQFALGLLFYKLLITGNILTEEQMEQVSSLTKVENILEAEETINNNQKKYIKNTNNLFNKF